MSDSNNIAMLPVRLLRWIVNTTRMFLGLILSYASALLNPANAIVFVFFCLVIYFYVYIPPWEQPQWLPFRAGS
jgi:hypothetical protein